MKSTKKFGSILTHEEKEYIDLGAPRMDAIKIFKRKAYTWRKKDMNKATKGLELVLKEMEKSKERLKKKAEKERKKLDEIYVTVKGEKVYKEKDLWELFESDVINGNQYDTYRDKLEQK